MTNKHDQEEDSAPMEQVRDLLFGNQLKTIDTRFQRQEEYFLREINDVAETLKHRLDSLENFMRSETTSLLNKLNSEITERESALKDEQRIRETELEAEQKARTEAFDKLYKEMAKSEEVFERKINKLSHTLETTEQEIKKLMMAENSNLSSTIEERYRDAMKALKETADQIRSDMVHRSSLSTMLAEMVVKLSTGEWSDPLVDKPAAPKAKDKVNSNA